MIRQFTSSEYCLKCQGCCRFAEENSPWQPCLLRSEAEALGQKKIQVVKPAGKDYFICSLLDPEDNKCKIYSARPFECQIYPFLINRRGGEVFLAVDLSCPLAKEKFNSSEFKQYSGYLAQLLQSREYLEIIRSNPQIIQEYRQATDLCKLPL